MKFGVALFGHHPPDVQPETNFQTVIEQVKTAERVGLDLVWAGQHYVMEEKQKFQVVPAMSRLAAESGDMYIGMNLLLPLHHPVEIAEQFATMDAMTGGRTIIGPIAGYRDKEFEAFGIDKHHRAQRLTEGVEIIKQLWTENEVTYRGDQFSFEDITITPKPVQDPHPPIWIGANKTNAVIRATELGDAWLINPHDREGVIEEQLNQIEPPTGSGFRGLQPVMKDGFIAETDDRALDIYRPYLEEFYGWYQSEGQGDAMETPEALDLDTEGVDRFLIGSPETVAEEIVRLHDNWGIGCVILLLQKPGIPHQNVLEAIKLYGKQVVPRVTDKIESSP